MPILILPLQNVLEGGEKVLIMFQTPTTVLAAEVRSNLMGWQSWQSLLSYVCSHMPSFDSQKSSKRRRVEINLTRE